MSILRERNTFEKENPFEKKKTFLENTSINNFVTIIPKKILVKRKKPLDDISSYINQTTSDSNPPITTPKKINIQCQKIVASNKFKPSTLQNKKKQKKILLTNINKNRDKTPENNLRNTTPFPINNQGINISNNNINYMILNIGGIIKNIPKDDNFKLPLDNYHSEFKHPKIKINKNNHNFFPEKNSKDGLKKIKVVINNKIKRLNEEIENSNLNEERTKTITIEKSKDKNSKIGITRNTLLRKIVKKDFIKNGKLNQFIQTDKNNDINQNQITNDFGMNENNNFLKTEIKENINKENILKEEIKKDDDDEFRNLEINIIKNKITRKFLIKNVSKEKRENKLNLSENEGNKRLINSNNNKMNNNSKRQTISIDFNKNKMQINKINDINVKESLKDVNIREPMDKINKNKENIKKSEKVIQMVEVEKEKNNEPNKKIIKENKNDESEKNAKIKKINRIILQNNTEKNNNFQKKIKSPKINNQISLKEKKLENKSNIVQNITKNGNGIKIKGNKIEHLEENTNNKKVEKMQINNNLIKDIITRYQIFPVIELRKSKSEIFSNSQKKSPLFIFNKIISLIENKNKITSSNAMHNLNQQNNDQIQFNPNDFKYLDVIGTGEYGKIYLVQWITYDNQFYALKYEKFKEYEDAQRNQNNTRIIKNFISKTRSKGIIKIYGDICLKSKNIYHYYTLMEKSERDVEQECQIRNYYKKYYTEKNLIDILCQLILTCSSLQKNWICHGDIKPQNILILNGFYKLSDFGEVKIIDPKGFIEQDIGGTELYMSPKLFFALKNKKEFVIHNAYKSDVFSLALCMLLMATFDYQILVRIRELLDMEKLKEIVKSFLSKRYSNHLIDFLLWMLEIDERKRPDFIELESKLVKK